MTKYKYTTISDQEIIFRTITLDESARFLNGIKLSEGDPYADEYIFDIITENAYDTDSLDAGIVPIIIFLSFALSGAFKEEIDIPNKIDTAREDITGSAFYLMYATICKAQPGYTLDILKTKTANEILELFAFSEMVLGRKEVDTDKAREAVAGPKTTAPKGVKAITKEEIANLQETLGMMEFDGVLQDEYRF